MLRPIKRLLGDRTAATIVEFAIVAPVFFLILFAVVEFGLVTFYSVAIESSVMHASRAASIGITAEATGACSTTTDRLGYVTCMVRDKTSALINSDRITIAANPVSRGGVPASATPDICMTNPPNIGGICPTGTPWQDVNGNGVYDAGTAAGDSSLGTYGELVEMRIYYPWRVQMPFMSNFFGCQSDQSKAGCQKGVIMITSSTVFKNEPFGSGVAVGGGSSSSGSSTSSTSSTSSAGTSAGGGGGGCFTGETMILMADGSYKRVDALKAGDMVRGLGGDNRVRGVYVYDVDEELYSINYSTPFMSASHSVWTREGWKSIDPELTFKETGGTVVTTRLQVGDVIRRSDGREERITSLVRSHDGKRRKVYDPTLYGDHTYYANDMLVHNLVTVQKK